MPHSFPDSNIKDALDNVSEETKESLRLGHRINALLRAVMSFRRRLTTSSKLLAAAEDSLHERGCLTVNSSTDKSLARFRSK